MTPAVSLRATSTLISSLHKHVAALKILESLKNWSGHGLSNRTSSAGPVSIQYRAILALIMLHIMTLALILTFNHLANELLQATTMLYGLMYLTYGSATKT